MAYILWYVLVDCMLPVLIFCLVKFNFAFIEQLKLVEYNFKPIDLFPRYYKTKIPEKKIT